MAIMGTHDIQDVLTDIVNVPTGTITSTNRYKSAVDMYNKFKDEPGIVRIVAHSLGGLEANEMNNRIKGVDKIPITIYNAPLITGISKIKPNVHDYSTVGDIVSLGDLTAKRKTIDINPVSAHFTYKK